MWSIPYYVGKGLQTLGYNPILYVSYADQDADRVQKNLGGIDHIHIPSQLTITVQLQYHEDINKRTQHISYVPHTLRYEDLGNEIENYDIIVLWPLFYYDIDPQLFKQLAHKRLVLGNFGMFTYAVDGIMIKQYPERARALLPYIDTLFLDEEELLFITGEKTIDIAIKYISQYVNILVVTRGYRGSIIYKQGNRYNIPAFPPKQIVDPTGSGDTYLAAFLSKEQETDDYAIIGRFAAMAATCKIEHLWPLIATKNQIEEKIGSYNL